MYQNNFPTDNWLYELPMALSLSEGRPPHLSGAEVSSLVLKYFNFSAVCEDSVKSLPGYDDRNYFFNGKTTSEKIEPFVLKVFNNIHSSVSEIEGCHQLIRCLHAANVISQVPKNSRTGEDVIVLETIQLKGIEGSSLAVFSHNTDMRNSNLHGKPSKETNSEFPKSYAVSVLSFVPGDLFDEIDKKYLIPSVLRDIGIKAANMDKVLKVTKL